jgi:hypothetical protein
LYVGTKQWKVPHFGNGCPSPVLQESLTDALGRKFKIVHLLRSRRESGIHKYSDKWDLSREFPQQTQSLRLHIIGPKGKACDVAAESIKACNKAGLDGVASHSKDDQDRRGCLLGDESRNITAETNEDSHLSADQIGGQSW